MFKSRFVAFGAFNWLILGVVEESVLEDNEFLELRRMLWPSTDDGFVDWWSETVAEVGEAVPDRSILDVSPC